MVTQEQVTLWGVFILGFWEATTYMVRENVLKYKAEWGITD